ncbi:MAG: ABC transporter ATP-binding protein [Desulfosarcinaceae bacterium]|nr:ABC transporter ATP-binding protein [Desulfosarcinaceae bacterium]
MIEIRRLSHRFGDGTQGLINVDLRIAAGEFVAIVGANGSGKTTLLRHLNGLLQPTEGEVRLKGESVSRNLKRARQIVGMVFQDADSQIVGETVFDDVAFGPENLCLPTETVQARVTTALRSVGLADKGHLRPHLLSGGEKRRLAVAGVLAMQSEVIAFDEPFSNLDYPGVGQVLAQMLALRDTGATILVTTHDIEKLLPHAERVVVMAGGRIRADGPATDILPHLETYAVRVPCATRLGLEPQSWLT